MKMHTIEVWGDFACFTRPEMKVERVSYEVMTPSAARAVFEAILWRPAIRWQVLRIEVLRPIRWINLRRNEVGAVVPVGSVEDAMRDGAEPLLLYVEDERQQRAGLFLRDVAYRIEAEITLTSKATATECITKFSEMFRRRASKGQCFNQPYLGCREFSCGFCYVESMDTRNDPIVDSRDLGIMLYDIDFDSEERPRPLFFRAALSNGVLNVPARTSGEVLA
jgi:CRISPR-associated protein Cas5d